MDVGSKLQELNLTSEELNRFSKAFKDEKFREMLKDYAEEISDPENKKKYEEEIRLMEQERGMDIKFVHPTPGRVLKTSLGGKQKCFINVCSNDLISKPECRAERGGDGRSGQHWWLPYSVTPGRPEVNSKGNKYLIYDVIFHPDTLYIAGKNPQFMKMVDGTAVQGVQEQCKVQLDQKNVKVLTIKYKGVPNPTVIRKPVHGHAAKENVAEPNDPLRFPYPYDKAQSQSHNTQEDPTSKNRGQNQTKVTQADPNKPTEPHHTVHYRSYIDLQDYRCSRDSTPSPRPKEIVITIDLPLLKSSEKADLNVTEKLVIFESLNPSYRLELPLAYPVDEKKGGAKFNKLKKQLIVTLPVLPLKSSPLAEIDRPGSCLTPLVGRIAMMTAICSGESGCRTDTSKPAGPRIKDELPGAKQAEPAAGREENFNEEEEADIPHQSPDDSADEKSEPASAIVLSNLRCGARAGTGSEPAPAIVLSNLRCGARAGTGSSGAGDEGPSRELGPVPRSASAEGQGSHHSLPPEDEVAAGRGERAPGDATRHRLGPATGGQALEDAVQLRPLAQGEEAEETGELSGPVGEEESAVGAVGEEESAVGEEESAVGGEESAVGEEESAVGEEESAVGEEESAVGGEESAVGGEESAMGAVGEEESAELDEDDLPVGSKPPPVVLREIGGENLRAEAISDHATSAAFSFQNALLYELD
ncbi:hypothetical protein AAFF_G00048220 [Aldrovandia affinis]|uniref:Protein kintoun n=1 Tax=Aldrovandia affinis TaxID=143900 RepID=A0AAD7S1H6_9TELE|nr:hypothetical protein AAFF_G00048220 [Aldrovandia affinis]